MTAVPSSGAGSLTAVTVLRIFLPFAFAYFLSFLFRVVNAVIAPDLIDEIALSASNLGFMTSAYLLCFASFQLPLGILLDRYGPRRTEACLLIVAAVGAFVFAHAESVTGLVVGRGLIGFGVSACLMAAFTSFARWFPTEKLAFVNGLQAAAGGLGAVAGTVPVELALGWTDWRVLFLFLGALTLGAAGFLYLAVPRRNEVGAGGTFFDQIRGTVDVVRSRVFRAVMPATVICQASFLSIQTLWTGPWFRDVAGMERGQAAEMLMAIAGALVVGMVAFGVMSQTLSRRGVSPERFMAVSMASFCLVLAAISFAPVDMVVFLWVVFGFMGGSVYLPFAVMVSHFPRAYAGRVATAVNVISFTTAFILQWAIGVVVDLWPRPDGDRFAAEGFTTAFASIAALQMLCILWLALNWRHVERREPSPPAV